MVVTQADPAKEATATWLRSQWRRYYETTKRILPDRFGRREFGFMFFNSSMVIRHQGFSREQDLSEFLVDKVPAHVYYSSAYYDKPNAPTMEEKGWLGADLIFDLDADHLPNAKSMSYPEMLEAIRQMIIKLYDEFLASDFGFDEHSMQLVFSGGRGYHIHVRDPTVWELGSHERREIVDYITGKGLTVEALVHRKAIEVKRWKDGTTVKYGHVMPDPTASGWPGRLSRGISEATTTWEKLPKEEAIAHLSKAGGLSPKVAAEMYAILFDVRGGVRGVDKIRRGNLDIFPSDRYLEPFMNLAIPLAVDLAKRETDEPVTSDIKRLIRLPSSLHGKTGLRVIPLTRDQVDDFRPLRDAVPDTWTDERVSMRFANRINLEIKGEAFNLEPGVNNVPQFLAIFAAARGLATVNPEA